MLPQQDQRIAVQRVKPHDLFQDASLLRPRLVAGRRQARLQFQHADARGFRHVGARLPGDDGQQSGRLLVSRAAHQDFRVAQMPGEVGLRIARERAPVSVGRLSEIPLVDIDVAKGQQCGHRSTARQVEQLIDLGRPDRLFKAEPSVGLQQKVIRFFRITQQQFVTQRDGFMEFLLFEESPAQPEFPVIDLRLEHHRQPVGTFCRQVLVGHGIGISQQPVSRAVRAAQFDAAGQRFERGREFIEPDADEAQVLVGALKRRVFLNRSRVAGDGICQAVLLEMEVSEREIENRAGGGLAGFFQKRRCLGLSAFRAHQRNDLFHDLLFHDGDTRFKLSAHAVRPHKRLLEGGVAPKGDGLLNPFLCLRGYGPCESERDTGGEMFHPVLLFSVDCLSD
ncbi:MAG: hypothetical protein BWX70_03050 [Verrucomicrobia bacterium ADurb.Bin070]|nr:MAG: hypothetical protein BWX70_03050 [Verrucomicrobia bacterium ADurb.Bin070]